MAHAQFLQALGQDGIGLDVGQDHKAFFDQQFGGLQGLHRVGQQILGLGGELQLHPGRQAHGPGHPGQAHGLFGGAGPGGVGQDQVFLGVQHREDAVGLRLAQIHAAQGHGDDFGFRGIQGGLQGRGGGKLARAHQEAGAEGAAGDD